MNGILARDFSYIDILRCFLQNKICTDRRKQWVWYYVPTVLCYDAPQIKESLPNHFWSSFPDSKLYIVRRVVFVVMSLVSAGNNLIWWQRMLEMSSVVVRDCCAARETSHTVNQLFYKIAPSLQCLNSSIAPYMIIVSHWHFFPANSQSKSSNTSRKLWNTILQKPVHIMKYCEQLETKLYKQAT